MFWADFRLKIGRFFRKNLRIIIFILIIWLLIVVINNLLKGYVPEKTLNVTYNPHESVLNSEEKVPNRLVEPINNLVDEYFNYCQNKEYEKAYNMLLDGCKQKYFRTILEFKDYVDMIFNGEKIYYIQNYSNYKNNYIYQIRIFENIMRTGLTGVNDISFYEEKISICEVNGELKLGIRQYISTETMDNIYEDDYLKIWVEKKDTLYEQESYQIRIRNKSNFIAVLADNSEEMEAMLVVGSAKRESLNSNISIVMQPGETILVNLDFTKFYDETYLSNGIIFNAVRILKTYSGLSFSRQYELENAERLYSIQIPF